jgi:hypothetical protein
METIKNLKKLLKNNYDSASTAVNTVTSIVTGNTSRLDYESETMSNPAFKKQVEESGWRPSAGPKQYTKRKKKKRSY